MGGTQSSYDAQDFFKNIGGGIGDFFGTVAGDIEGIFKNLMSTGTSLLSSPIFLIGGGCVVLYLVISTKGQVAQAAGNYASR